MLMAAILLALGGSLAACGQIKPAENSDNNEHAGGGY
jgi:hypothetical protein